MFTFLIFSEVYYHLCNNRCGGVNGPPRNQMRHLRQVGGVKEINSDECDKECRLNCQTESKISAADEMGGGKLNPTMKKIFFRKYYGILQRNFFFNFFFFMKARMGSQLKRSQKVQLCICLLEYGFLSLY